MNLGAANLKLGWLVLGAVTWAYLGLLAALGMPAQPGARGQLDLGLRHAPEIVAIPGSLHSLREGPDGLHIVVRQRPEAPARLPALPLPPGIRVEYAPADEPPRRPLIELQGGHGPFRLPTGQQGVIAGGYFVRYARDAVRIGPVPENMRRRLQQRQPGRPGPDGELRERGRDRLEERRRRRDGGPDGAPPPQRGPQPEGRGADDAAPRDPPPARGR